MTTDRLLHDPSIREKFSCTVGSDLASHPGLKGNICK